MKPELFRKLYQFAQSTKELSNAWIKADVKLVENDIKCTMYPLTISFDEFSDAVQEWLFENEKGNVTAMFHTHLLNEEVKSSKLADIEAEIIKHAGVTKKELGSPIIYFPKDVPERLGLMEEDADLYSHVLVYGGNTPNIYIGILK